MAFRCGSKLTFKIIDFKNHIFNVLKSAIVTIEFLFTINQKSHNFQPTILLYYTSGQYLAKLLYYRTI